MKEIFDALKDAANFGWTYSEHETTIADCQAIFKLERNRVAVWLIDAEGAIALIYNSTLSYFLTLTYEQFNKDICSGVFYAQWVPMEG